MSKKVNINEVMDLQLAFSSNVTKASLQDLLDLRDRVHVMLDNLDEEFSEYQSHILTKLHGIIKHHLQMHFKYTKTMTAYMQYFKEISAFYQQLASAVHFDELELSFVAFIDFCKQEEVKLVLCDYRLSDTLQEKLQEFRRQGLMPRDFKRDLQAPILQMLQAGKAKVRQESAIVRWNGDLFAMLQGMFTSVESLACNSSSISSEEDLVELFSLIETLLLQEHHDRFNSTSAQALQSIAEELRNFGVRDELQFVGIFRANTRKATQQVMRQLRKSLDEQGWLRTGLANDHIARRYHLRKLQNDVGAQIVMREQQLSKQLIDLQNAHACAINRYLRLVSYAEPVNVWLTAQLQNVQNMLGIGVPKSEAEMQDLRQIYQQFWRKLIANVDERAQMAQESVDLHQSKQRSAYLQLRNDVYHAASYLRQEAKVLSLKFIDFDVRYILKALQEHLHQSYRFSFLECSEERKAQLLALQQRLLAHGRDPLAVGMILEQEIKNIMVSHMSQSKAYNFSLWRKASRSVDALSGFLNHCVTRGWAVLPSSMEVLQVEQLLHQQTQRYFDQFLFGSLLKRGVVARVWQAIYEVKVKLLQQGDYTKWQGLQHIADVLSLVIKQEKAQHDNQFTTRVLRFFGFHARCDFVEHLAVAQRTAETQKYLPTSFVTVHLPAIQVALQQVQATIAAMEDSHSLVNVLTKFNDEKTKAQLDLAVLLRHLQYECRDAQAAGIAIAQVLDKFENEEYYQNRCFYQQLQRVVVNLQVQGHLQLERNVLGTHLKDLQEGLQAVRVQAHSLRARAGY